MAELTVNSVSKAGLADVESLLVPADVAGDFVPASSGLLFMVKNDDTAAKVVTVTRPVASVSCGGYGELDLDDIAVTVAPATTSFLSIPSKFASAANFNLTYDDVTSVTVGVFSVAP